MQNDSVITFYERHAMIVSDLISNVLKAKLVCLISQTACCSSILINKKKQIRTHSFLFSLNPNYATSHSAISSVMFFDRNTSMSTDVGFRLARRLLTISPALDNSLSEGTEVDGSKRLDKTLEAISVRCKQKVYYSK